MFFMMMWIGLSNNQTIEIELFGTLEAEENSQFALDMNFLLHLVQLNLIKRRQLILDHEEHRHLKFY